MKDYLKYILDLIIRDKNKNEREMDDRPSIQIEIQDDYIIDSEKKKEEEKKSSVIIIDI
jgi:hypothetical protein